MESQEMEKHIESSRLNPLMKHYAKEINSLLKEINAN